MVDRDPLVYASILPVEPVFVSFSYLRFYEDGSVIESTVSGQMSADLPWFNRADKTIGQGRYSLSGSSIEFCVRSKAGSLDYGGPIVGDALHLEFLSHINGNRWNDDYSFLRSRVSPLNLLADRLEGLIPHCSNFS